MGLSLGFGLGLRHGRGRAITYPPSPPAGLPMSFFAAGGANGIPNVSTTQAALQFERTQPWTGIVQVQLPAPPTVVASSTQAAIVFTTCNQGSGTAFPGYEYWLDGNGHIRVRIISNAGTANYLDVQSSFVVPDNNWHSIAVSYDGSSLAAGVKIYVDGVLDTSPTVVVNGLTTSIVNAQPFVVGAQLGFPYPLGGNMKNFMLSNVVRSQAWIAAYTTAAGAVDANTVLAYNFSEGSGTTTADLSSNGFTGTVNNAQWAPVAGAISAPMTDNAQDNTAKATYTWRTLAVNPLATVVGIAIDARVGANTTAALNSLTVNGTISATKITDSRNTSGGALSTTSVWHVPVPLGTTSITVSAPFTATMARADIKVASIIGSNGVVPSGAAVANVTGTSTATSASATITVPTKGVALIFGSASVLSTPTVTPTNYTTFGGPVDAGTQQLWYSCGYDTTPGSRTYTIAWTGSSASVPTLACVAWSA